MKTIFLDFDGVLNSATYLDGLTLSPWYPCLDPRRAERVQRICNATGAKLVISSSWRAVRWFDDHGKEKHHTERDIGELVRWLREAGITAEVVGCTTLDVLTLDVAENRALQIQRYAQRYCRGPWLALDDFKLTALLGRALRTSERTGLTDADVTRAIEMLGGAQ